MSYNWGVYASPTSCLPKIPQGAGSLFTYLKDVFPYTFSMGICNCRNSRGGSSLSHHANCRAYDCGFATGSGGSYRPELGDPIIELLGPHGRALGLDHLILNRIIYSARSPDGRRYLGVHPHNNHAHIGLTNAAGINLNYASLVAILGEPAGGEDAMLPLKPNSAPEDIRSLQGRLNTAYNSGLKEDTIWGSLTQDAVKKNLLDFTNEGGAVQEGKKVNARMWDGLLADFIIKVAPAGTKGDKGDRGIQGAKGSDGSRGAKGDQGIQGDPGQRGLKGEDGEDGKPVTLKIIADTVLP